MARTTRIRAVYCKELAEILRDRRTLLAMIVIPVVLYPLMMLGFVWLAEREEVQVESQTFVIEVEDARTQQDLGVILSGAQEVARSRGSEPHQFKMIVGSTSLAALGDEVQLRVSTPAVHEVLTSDQQLNVTVHYSEVNVHSRTAMQQFSESLDQFGWALTNARLGRVLEQARGGPVGEGQINAILRPIGVNPVSAATDRQRGGWALGMIVPVVLVLMTITGAVYPAIDLTAGERERGTLETLMVSPVPILDIVVGKFLVVATMAMTAATLNVASVGATMHLSGMTRMLASEKPLELPLSALPIVLLCMVPMTLLFSAVLVAVCSFARTFKEAQNYVMPVIISAIIPAIAVTLPSVRLQGILLIVPVGNMVLLARDLFQQQENMLAPVVVVLLSTSLYAAAAIAVATRLFGQEAVLFVDAGSYKTLFQRRHFRPAPRPTAAQALLLAALVFPVVFYLQFLLSGSESTFLQRMQWVAMPQFVGLFFLLPLALSVFLKIDIRQTFSLRRGSPRVWGAALMIGLSSWALAYELVAFQQQIMPPSALRLEQAGILQIELARGPFWLVILLLAVLPGITEEWFLRGFVLSGLRSAMTKWGAIATSAMVFGTYHMMIDRLPITILLGTVLGYLCWQSGSLGPCMLMHAMHNALTIGAGLRPELQGWLGISSEPDAHLPMTVLVVCGLLLVGGLLLAWRPNRSLSPADTETNTGG